MFPAVLIGVAEHQLPLPVGDLLVDELQRTDLFPESEKNVLQFWDEHDIYEKSLEQRKDSPPFVFYEGPPTANGLPHPGHCLTRVIKDLFPRYKTMRGYCCHRKGGWDTHGLPVEVEVCKDIGIHSKEEIEAYGIEPFVRKCIESVFRYTKQWEDLTRRLGFWINLDDAYVTYQRSYIESVWWALKTLHDKGLLYQGHKVVWWWPQGGTALSSGEVGQGYKEIDDPSVYVRFKLTPEGKKRIDSTGKLADKEVSFLAWTTTPWTLPSNVALAVNPNEDYYCVLQKNGEYLIAARALVEGEDMGARIGFSVDENARGETIPIPISQLIGCTYEPIFTYASPEGGKAHEVIEADFVTLDTGTGIVHLAPAFGEDDYRVCRDKGMGFLQLIAPDGTFVPEATDFAGRFCKEADKDIIRWMKDKGVLLKREVVRHEYPFCWRAPQDPLIQYARKGWFIRTTEFKDQIGRAHV